MRTILAVFLVFVCTLELLFAQTTDGTDAALNGTSGGSGCSDCWSQPLVWAEIAYIATVLLAGFLCTRFRSNSAESAKLKGMNLPEGTIRSMLALLIVGAFVIFLVLGSELENFDKVVTAFGTLAGAVLGFYFAHRGAQPAQNGTTETITKENT